MPETDSVRSGSAAAKEAMENINWQMVIGGALLVLILVAVIAIVSVNVSAHVGNTGTVSRKEPAPEVAAETTAVPIPTATPTPTPEPTPQITSITITSPVWGGQSNTGFMEPAGSQVDLDATPYPMTENVTVTWSSTDESVATVDQDGVVTVVGTSGYCDIVASVGTVQATCRVWAR